MNELIKYKNNVGMQQKKSDTAGKMYVENRVEKQKYDRQIISFLSLYQMITYKITKQNDIQRRHEISKTFVSMRLAKQRCQRA